jgi:hypothetical protein
LVKEGRRLLKINAMFYSEQFRRVNRIISIYCGRQTRKEIFDVCPTSTPECAHSCLLQAVTGRISRGVFDVYMKVFGKIV